MKNAKERLIEAKAKLEVYKEIDIRVEAIMNGDIDMVEGLSQDLYILKESFEELVDDLEIELEESEDESKKRIMSEFVKNMETWTTLTDSEAAIIISKVENERLEPISISSSLHVFEERFNVDGDTFIFLTSIGGDEKDLTIQKLEK